MSVNAIGTGLAAVSDSRLLSDGVSAPPCCIGAASDARTPQYFEEPALRPHLLVPAGTSSRGTTASSTGRLHEPIDRGRFELRPEIDFASAPDLRVGVRGIFDYGTEERVQRLSTRTTTCRAARTSTATTSCGRRAPGRVRGGGFAMPIAASEMLWDKSTSRRRAARPRTRRRSTALWSLTSRAAGFYGAQHGPRRRRSSASARSLWRTGDENRFAVEASRRVLGHTTCGTSIRRTSAQNHDASRTATARRTARSSTSLDTARAAAVPGRAACR